MDDKEFAHEIVRRCCRVYFTGIKPENISFYLSKPGEKFEKRRRIMGIQKKIGKQIIIQADAEFVKTVDPVSLTEKIAYTLAHIKLKTSEKYSLKHEAIVKRELNKFFRALKNNDRKLMKKF